MLFTLKKQYFVGLVISQTLLYSVYGQGLYEGELCRFQNGESGRCKKITECSTIMDELKKRLIKYSDLVGCGFVETVQVICCKDTVEDRIGLTTTTTPKPFTFDSTSTTTTSRTSLPLTQVGSKASEACKIYTENARTILTFHILDGVPTIPGEFPHVAAIGYPDPNGLEWNCGGTLINARYVLTAAHCLPQSRLPTTIRLGKTSLNSNADEATEVDRTIQRIIRHPGYTSSQVYNDIALIEMNSPVDYDNVLVRPACLYNNLNDVSPSEDLIITGWGRTDGNTQAKSDLLLKANVTSISLTSCNNSHVEYGLNRRYRQGLNLGQMCAWDPELKKDTCLGDSGGPIQIVDSQGISTVVGITSFGLSCGSAIPSVYTRIAYYLDWIESIAWP